MCGINGYIDQSLISSKGAEILKSMNSLLSHRGPDGSGIFIDKSVGLGHTRLSIIDLSKAANQPMLNQDRTNAISFNGEIYNFQELRKKLINQYKCNFITNSDTEVLLNLINVIGIDSALDFIEGMFAFAYLDIKDESLVLARDRLGEKPLYYFFNKESNKLYFSSELRALTAILKNTLTLNPQNLDFFLNKSYLPNNSSIFSEIKKVEPGTYIRFNFSDNNIKDHPVKYWDYLSFVKDSISNNKKIKRIDYNSKKKSLEKLILSKVNQAMVSDVPLGAFLSGGYDSSLMVALMQSLSINKIKTFSIGFEDKAFDEAPYAKSIANHLGTEHDELYISKNDLLELIPKLPQIYSEPFADSSQIPTVLLSRLTRKKVTVSISGDGGDEIFGGYGRYFLGERVKQILNFAPLFLRKGIHQANLINKSKPLLKLMLSNKVSNFENKILKLNEIIPSKDDHDLFQRLSRFNNKFSKYPYEFLANEIWLEDCSYSRKAMTDDTIDYLPGDILQKVDIAGMSCSLETRIPLLNHKLIEKVLELPHSFLIKDGIGKVILKDIVHQYIPKSLMERPKKGFEVPLNGYLRNELREYSQEMLNYGRRNFNNILNFKEIDYIWEGHMNKNFNQPHLLWNLITFFAWHETYF